jgi:hypothetical protein
MAQRIDLHRLFVERFAQRIYMLLGIVAVNIARYLDL